MKQVTSLEKKVKEISNIQSLKNNIYALKTGWDLSRSRVIHSAIISISGYFEWLFYSTFFMRYIIDAIDNQKSFKSIFSFILLCCIIFISNALYLSYVNNYVFPLTNTKIFQGLYTKLYKKAKNVELHCFEDAEFYNKYTMAIDGAGDKITAIISNIFKVVFGVIAAGVAFYTMFSIDHLAILFIIFPILGNFLFGGIMNKLYTKRYSDNVPFDRKSQYINRVMYLADYAKEVKLSNIYHLMMRKYEEAVKGTIGVAEKYSKKAIINYWLQTFLTFTIVFEGIMAYAAYRTMILKNLALAELAIMFSVMVTSTWILINLFNALLETFKNGLFIEYLRTFLEYEEKIPEDQDGIIPDTNIRTIEFRNVEFFYKKDQPLIHNLSFQIKGNSNIALVGHNGAGKSTILKLLFRLYDPTSGEILVNGINIKKYNLKAYRNLFAAAFQDYKVMALSIKDNILMGRHVENEDKVVTDALEKAGIMDKVRTLPNGIHTILTKEFAEDGAVLSGGQYQKIVVARAFAQNSPIKVFDEPSSALDPIAEYELYKSIMRESKDKTMLFISHRLSSVRDADMVFMFENGSLIESGTHQDLMKAEGAYADMYTKQARNYLAVEEDCSWEVLY